LASFIVVEVKERKIAQQSLQPSVSNEKVMETAKFYFPTLLGFHDDENLFPLLLFLLFFFAKKQWKWFLHFYDYYST
jgi:hypothetical protein